MHDIYKMYIFWIRNINTPCWNQQGYQQILHHPFIMNTNKPNLQITTSLSLFKNGLLHTVLFTDFNNTNRIKFTIITIRKLHILFLICVEIENLYFVNWKLSNVISYLKIIAKIHPIIRRNWKISILKGLNYMYKFEIQQITRK